jgi:hypothetical protein
MPETSHRVIKSQRPMLRAARVLTAIGAVLAVAIWIATAVAKHVAASAQIDVDPMPMPIPSDAFGRDGILLEPTPPPPNAQNGHNESVSRTAAP